MMARRALHLRWNYVEDHPVLFGGLALLFVALIFLAAVLAGNPLRGLLIGTLPVLFAIVVWAITNQASYRLRAPETLPEERSDEVVSASAPRAGDPFEESQQEGPLSPAEQAVRAAKARKKSRRSGKGKPPA